MSAKNYASLGVPREGQERTQAAAAGRWVAPGAFLRSAKTARMLTSHNAKCYEDFLVHRLCQQVHPSIDELKAIESRNPRSFLQPDSSGNLPLHYACRNAQMDLVTYLLERFPQSLNFRGSRNRLPIHFCCCKSDVKNHGERLRVVEFLLEQSPNSVREMDSTQLFPLHLACMHHTLPLMRHLVSLWPEALERENNEGCLPLHKLCEAPMCNLPAVKCLVHVYPEGTRRRDSSGALPLHLACMEGNQSVVEFLSTEYPEGIKLTDHHGMLPFHYACGCNSGPTLVDYLVKRHPDSVRLPDNRGRRGLHAACRGEGASLSLVQYLVEHNEQSIRLATQRRQLPIHIACATGAPLSIVQYLANKYPASIRISDRNRRLPLHLACRRPGSLPVIRFLLQQDPGSVKVAGGFDQLLPIHEACRQTASLEILQFLIKQYPAGIRRTNRGNALPVHMAASNRASWSVVQYLLVQHPICQLPFWPEYVLAVEPPMSFVRIVLNQLHRAFISREGWLPLHAVVQISHDDYFYLAIQCVLKYFPESIRYADKHGRLPLHNLFATKRRVQEGCVQFLVNAFPGALDTVDQAKKRLPLHYACWNGFSLHILEFLVQKSPNSVKIRDGDGSLPLHLACHGSQLSCLRYLVQSYPESMSISNQNGELPLHVAISQGASLDSIFYLLQQSPDALVRCCMN